MGPVCVFGVSCFTAKGKYYRVNTRPTEKMILTSDMYAVFLPLERGFNNLHFGQKDFV